MSVPAFTPGPWEIFRYDSSDPYLPGIEALDGSLSVVVFGCPDDDSCGVHGRNDEEAEANARLIAAAPDLFEAARLFVEEYDGGDESNGHQMMLAYDRALTAARRALRKARGDA